MPATICYAVTVADVNGDRKPDVVAVTEDAVVWYENPSWQKHDIIRRRPPGITSASSRTTSTATAGSISPWAPAGVRPTPRTRARSSGSAATRQGRWQIHPIQFEEPTLHRLRWGDVKGTGKKQLVVAPLQGRGTKGPNWGEGQGARVLVYDVPEKPENAAWPVEVADSSLHTIHNLQLVDIDGDRRDEIVVAAWEGVFVLDRDPAGHWTKTRIGTGNQDHTPFKGSSEVKVGRLRTGIPTSPRSSPGTVIRSWFTRPAAHEPGSTTRRCDVASGRAR